MTDFGVPVLASLVPPVDLAFIQSLAQRRKYADKELIHERGDRQPAMGLVVRGRVELVSPRSNGREYFVSMINAGQNYGDIAVVGRKSRAHRATAVGETEVDHLSADAFALILERPAIVAALYRVAAYRLATVIDFVDDMRALAPELRLAKLLLQMNQHEPQTGGRIDFLQEELAGFLGVSTVTLAKALRCLRDDGLIETGYRQITVIDRPGLASWIARRDPE